MMFSSRGSNAVLDDGDGAVAMEGGARVRVVAMEGGGPERVAAVSGGAVFFYMEPT